MTSLEKYLKCFFIWRKIIDDVKLGSIKGKYQFLSFSTQQGMDAWEKELYRIQTKSGYKRTAKEVFRSLYQEYAHQ